MLNACNVNFLNFILIGYLLLSSFDGLLTEKKISQHVLEGGYDKQKQQTNRKTHLQKHWKSTLSFSPLSLFPIYPSFPFFLPPSLPFLSPSFLPWDRNQGSTTKHLIQHSATLYLQYNIIYYIYWLKLFYQQIVQFKELSKYSSENKFSELTYLIKFSDIRKLGLYFQDLFKQINIHHVWSYGQDSYVHLLTIFYNVVLLYSLSLPRFYTALLISILFMQ